MNEGKKQSTTEERGRYGGLVDKDETSDWASTVDVDRAVEEYMDFLLKFPKRTTHLFEGSWCLDRHGNQVQGCRCAFDLYEKKNSGNTETNFEYEMICCGMALWFSCANELETTRAQTQTTLSLPKFKELFHKTVVLKHHQGMGAVTKMVDASIQPSLPTCDANEKVYIPENTVLTVSTFCLNTFVGIWRALVKQVHANPEDWEAIGYQRILYQGARNQIDSRTQIKRQKLFYARVEDFLAIGEDSERIPFTRAAAVYQETGELGEGTEEVKEWRLRNFYNWRNWKLQSIHILLANSSMKFNAATKDLVESIGIGIALVSEESLAVLNPILSELWKLRRKNVWKKVTQDKHQWFLPFPASHTILSALDALFCSEVRGNRATGELRNLITTAHCRSAIGRVDDEIRDVILEELNKKNTGTMTIKKVAFQPSFLVSEVHYPQSPHFDYKDEKDRRGDDVEYRAKFWIGFLPLTEKGQFLQIWKYEKNRTEESKGDIVFIPKGHLVLVRGDTLHGGGFRADTEPGGLGSHGRLHFYIYPDVDECPMNYHGNEYKDPATNRNTTLSATYTNSDLLSGVAEGGGWPESMNWNFFQGECPIDKETGVELKVKGKRSTYGKPRS